MNRIPLLVSLLVCAIAGCSESPVAPADIQAISIEASYGECSTYCVQRTEVSSDLAGRYSERPNHEDPAFPPKERSFTLTAAEWNRLATLAATARQQPWQSMYGCPDCADQGAWQLTVKAIDETRTSRLDGNMDQNPAALRQLVEAIRALHPETR